MTQFEVRCALLDLLPMWNSLITSPFKDFLDNGVTSEMYYCIRTLKYNGGSATMTELAQYMNKTKQQMTKTVNRLVENDFVVRVDEPTDRRLVVIKMTKKGGDFIDAIIQNTDFSILSKMSTQELNDLGESLNTISVILANKLVKADIFISKREA